MPADHALNHRRLVDELISAEKPAGGVSSWRLIAPNVNCFRFLRLNGRAHSHARSQAGVDP